jgi:2-polyprenyl-6-methoxyphenol hydroxylase-like FAD-dependent oxidoreductase/predicted DsbA family dithiol-disulfide isomerase
MKAVIIGGGIAGLSVAILLRHNNWDVVVNEASKSKRNLGHAFLMSGEGLSVLEPFLDSTYSHLKKEKIEMFQMMESGGKEVFSEKLDSWYCIKRVDFIETLFSLVPEEMIKEDRVFSHFLYDNDKVSAAIFEDGSIEYGDLFIGADGGNSAVRSVLFGQTEYTPTQVREVVGYSTFQPNLDITKSTFHKYQHNKKGLSFGYIPSHNNQYVWFVQYDISLAGDEEEVSADLKSLCSNLLGDFCEEVQDILSRNDFTNAYVWQTRDFDLLPSFHKSNVVLIGDAAHLALPFTSAGTTNAILDAKVLADCLARDSDYEKVFKEYYSLRAPKIESHIDQGRNLKKKFLNPMEYDERDFLLPLISSDWKKEIPTPKPIKILYFTDPICSTCWLMQPVMRKLILDYESYIDIEYRMGGLLPSWVGFNRGPIRVPSDAAIHWEELSKLHDIPINGDIWLEDPLESSFPASVAFKAAQLQHKDLALLFLRRLKEMLFIEKRNISKTDVIVEAAQESGLFCEQLLSDMLTTGNALFEEDLSLASAQGVTVFPTVFFYMEGKECISLEGFNNYEQFEEIISDFLPGVLKNERLNDPLELFEKFNYLTEKEFSYLTDLPKEQSKQMLTHLQENDKIELHVKKNGEIWKCKSALLKAFVSPAMFCLLMWF